MNSNDTIDPLQLLRDVTLRGERVDADNEKRELFFEASNLRLPYDTQTAWKKIDKPDVLYSLAELYFFLKMRAEKPGDYLRECNQQKVSAVHYRDRDKLKDYFISHKEDKSNIDANIWAKTLIRRGDVGATEVVRKRDEKTTRKETEKVKKLERKMEVIDYLQTSEKRIHSRVTILQSQKRSFLKVLQLGYQMVSLKKEADRVKDRIEARGSIAKDVNLDVHFLKPNLKLNLLDEITRSQQGGANLGPKKGPRPIIIVPGLHEAGNLSLGNAKMFLEGGTYQDMKSELISSAEVTRHLCGREVTFDVFDSVTSFSETRWQRVVAVFVIGQEYQFRDWKGGSSSDKRKLFARVRAYNLSYAGSKPPATISNWNVTKLELPKFKRHQDVHVQTFFWKDLETFLKREKYKDCGF